MNLHAPIRLWASVLLVMFASMAAGQSDPVASGRRLFRGEPIPPLAMLEGVQVQFACLQCHARSGQGGTEAGITVPSVRWRDLQQPLAGVRGYADADAVARAITDGTGRNGRPLRAPMPRYTLDATGMRNLLAYLKVLGTTVDPPPGVEGDIVRVGSILPLSGALASTGRRIETAMRARAETINGQGGVYGRRIELAVVDGGSTAASLDAAVVQMKRDDRVLALVGSYLPGAAASGTSSSDMPMLHSLGVPLAEGGAHDSWLLASVAEQTRQLASYMAAKCAGPAETRVIYDGTSALREALLASEFSATQLQVAGEEAFVPATTGMTRWIVLLPRDRLHRVQTVLDTRGGCLGSVAVISGMPKPEASGVHSALREYVALPVPSTATPTELWPLLGDAAIQALAEALARSGRQFDRDDLQAASESLRGMAIGAGLTLNYDRRRRYGLDVGFAITGGPHGSID